MTARRALAFAVAGCALGAAVALLAATRTWTVQETRQSAPPAVLRTPRTGSALEPWLAALALVALAGAGALLATWGRSRALVGVLLVLAGAGVLAGGVRGLVAVAGVTAAWPVLAVAGALMICGGGGWAALRGRHWPAMGSRYERPGVPRTPAEDRPQRGGPSASDVAMWDALDRGEDPTRRAD
jgi:Tryptophan-associated transmembrane protein (Trp_oprn_chp)